MHKRVVLAITIIAFASACGSHDCVRYTSSGNKLCIPKDSTLENSIYGSPVASGGGLNVVVRPSPDPTREILLTLGAKLKVCETSDDVSTCPPVLNIENITALTLQDIRRVSGDEPHEFWTYETEEESREIVLASCTPDPLHEGAGRCIAYAQSQGMILVVIYNDTKNNLIDVWKHVQIALDNWKI